MYVASADTGEARADPYLLGRSLPRMFRLDEDDGDEDAWVEERGAMLRVLARLGMEMALDIGDEARAIRVDLEQDRTAREDGPTDGPTDGGGDALAAGVEAASAPRQAAISAPQRTLMDLALAFSRVSRAVRQCIEGEVKIAAYEAARDAAETSAAKGPGAGAGGVTPSAFLTPAEAKARTDSYVASIQRALDEIAEDHVYRAVRMLEGEEPDTSLTLYHEGSVTYRAATGAILKACRNLALARYKAHFDTGWIPAGDDDGEEDGDDLDDDEDAVTAPGQPP